MNPSKKKSIPTRPHTSQLQSASRHSRASVHIKNKSGKTANQRSLNSSSPNTLDQLAIVAAILSLIAAAIGLYIAWKSLSNPDQTAVVV
ncbi:hypothetical protein D3C76_1452700 [compost metagenome]|uniref:hypothetical protein n=1 Tax=Paenibacillus TaxID=44249 RepID=UPI00096C113A|nr:MULTISPECIES: hypothetical protein [Paenibacillus]MBY0119962.1 hypothetical protein [Paenibacillus xylanexedens]MCF7753057.1 hypothetical protein [Paenibacillus xylanexedens]OMF64568.1 hypothetical protein BK141_12810 [Paenibacillus sp. FSL R5-0765]